VPCSFLKLKPNVCQLQSTICRIKLKHYIALGISKVPSADCSLDTLTLRSQWKNNKQQKYCEERETSRFMSALIIAAKRGWGGFIGILEEQPSDSHRGLLRDVKIYQRKSDSHDQYRSR